MNYNKNNGHDYIYQKGILKSQFQVHISHKTDNINK